MSAELHESSVNQNDAHRRIAARNAVVQMLMRELYAWPDDAERSVAEFRELADDGDPIACAITNILTDQQIKKALTAPSTAHATHEEVLRALPVYPYLTPEQRERARLMRVTEDALEAALIAPSGDPGSRVVKALIGDLADRRGEEPKTNGRIQEIVEDLPEPWRRQARKALATAGETPVGP